MTRSDGITKADIDGIKRALDHIIRREMGEVMEKEEYRLRGYHFKDEDQTIQNARKKIYQNYKPLLDGLKVVEATDSDLPEECRECGGKCAKTERAICLSELNRI